MPAVLPVRARILVAVALLATACSKGSPTSVPLPLTTATTAVTATTATTAAAGTVVHPATGSPFPGIWPFATQAEVDGYAAGTDPTYRDPVATAWAFATTYLGMPNPATFGFTSTGPGAGDVGLGPRNSERVTFTVSVRQLGVQGAAGPWTVVGAASPDIVVASPGQGDRVASPAHLAGRAVAFEGTVNVTVREDGMVAAQSLGKGPVTGGGDQLRPFSGDVAFRAPSKPAGAVAFVELSAADGQVRKATVVRVRF